MADLRSNRSRSPLRSSLLQEAKTAASEAEKARQQLVREAMGRAQTAAAAAAAGAAAAAAPTGHREDHWSRAALKSVERQQTVAAKAKAMGSSISRQQAHASIIQSAQNMVKQGQKMLEVAAHEHAAGLSLIAAGEALAATIPAPEMPPKVTAIVPVAP